ncbi:MAG: hypothetical protein OXH26_09810 [bacterium]|nr:hypothetical protein [bacterium]
MRRPRREIGMRRPGWVEALLNRFDPASESAPAMTALRIADRSV